MKIRKLLHILYFSEQMAYANHIFNQLNLQFICYNMMQENGNYKHIHLILLSLAAQ